VVHTSQATHFSSSTVANIPGKNSFALSLSSTQYCLLITTSGLSTSLNLFLTTLKKLIVSLISDL